MRKVLLGIVLAMAFLWLAIWVASLLMRSAVRAGDENAWPLGLGTLSTVPQRYPAQAISPAATRLIALAQPLGIDIAPRDGQGAPPQRQPMEFVRAQVTEWAMEQLESPSVVIAPMPYESGEYFAGRAADLTTIQQLLLSEDPIRWPANLIQEPMPNLSGLLQLNRILVARALDRARFGDRGAWDDLRAAWNLAQPLLGRAELISPFIAMAMARNVNAAARKMPLPSPAWLSDLHRVDFRRALLGASQVDAWRANEYVHAETSVDTPIVRRAIDSLMAPYVRTASSDWAEASRQVAIRLASKKDCRVDAAQVAAPVAWWNFPARQIPIPNLTALWQRLFRFTPEVEGTIRALSLRSGEAARPQSSCEGERWIYAEDGRSFRFSDLMEPANPELFSVPLAFSLDAGK